MQLMTTAFAEEALRIRETGHLSDRDIARATGAGVSTVGAWIRGTRSPRGERAERLAELSAIVERLARVMQPSYIPVWLQKPVPDRRQWPGFQAVDETLFAGRKGGVFGQGIQRIEFLPDDDA